MFFGRPTSIYNLIQLDSKTHAYIRITNSNLLLGYHTEFDVFLSIIDGMYAVYLHQSKRLELTYKVVIIENISSVVIRPVFKNLILEQLSPEK